MENKEASKKTSREVRSPSQIAGIAFVVTIAVGLCTIVGTANFFVLFGGSESLARFNEAVVNRICPTAILVAVASYFWAKKRQDV